MYTVSFNTRPFERSHLKTPRGFGSWAFEVQGSGRPILFSHAMTYTEAKKWLKEQLKTWDIPADYYVIVDVLP